MASRLSFNALLCLVIACTAVGGRLANAAGVRPLTEEDLDRSQAAASFALAKSLYARSDLAGALRAYQSAWRWDPSRRELLDDIVSLAVSLGRADEAIRYAIVQSESGGVKPELLRRLALYAAESEQWEQAAVLYERWLAVAPERDASFEKALIRIELGRIYQQLGRFGDASRCVAEVQRTLLRTPNSEAARRLASALGGSLSQVYQTFGQCHLEAGEHTLASQAFAQLSNGDLPTGGGLQYWLAKLALAESQPLEAYSQLHAYFDSPGDPYGAEPYDLLRTTLIQLNDRGRLPAELSRIRQRRPQSLYALCADAHQLANSGRREEAAALLRRVIESAVSSEASIDQESFGESANWLIDFYAESDDANRLLPLLQQLTMVDPTLEKFTDSLTEAMDKKAFAAQMKTRLSMLLQTNPTEAERLLPASRLALILGENELAVDLFRKAIELVEEARGSMCLDFAVDLLLAEQNNLAAELIRNSVDEGVLDSEAPATWYYLSAALSSQKGADEAVAAARRAAELAPDSPEFAAHVARTLQIAGRQEQAIEEYATLLGRFDAESDSSVRQTLREARLSYSYLLLSEGEADAAVRELQLVLDEFPGDPGASNDLGYLWADRGLHPLRSVQLANDAVAAEPENPAYLDSLGWAFYKLGDLAQARNTLQRAVNATTVADPEILDHLGQTLAESGDVQAARQEWRRALAALADDAGRSELRDAIQKRLEPLEHDKQPSAPRGAE